MTDSQGYFVESSKVSSVFAEIEQKVQFMIQLNKNNNVQVGELLLVALTQARDELIGSAVYFDGVKNGVSKSS